MSRARSDAITNVEPEHFLIELCAQHSYVLVWMLGDKVQNLELKNVSETPAGFLTVVDRPCDPACDSPRRCDFAYKLARRNSCALTATMTVLADIRTAANAGGRRIPCAARTPAAKGMATML